MATLGDRERDGAGGTCRGALAKSPIITSKLDSGGGLSGTGSLQRMKHYRDSSKKKNPPQAVRFSPCHIPLPPSLYLTSSLISLVLLSSFLPPPLLTPPCVLSPPLTPGWKESPHSPPPNEFLHPLRLRQGQRTGGPGEPHL